MTSQDRSQQDRFATQRRRMVTDQLIKRGIKDQRVLEAMAQVPREEFMSPASRTEAYYDGAVPIGHGQTISQPYIVAHMLECLKVQPDHRVLEVGGGSGYQAAILTRLAKEVYAIEFVSALAAAAEQTLRRLGYDNVHVVVGDGSMGYPPAAPYDRIIAAAAAPKISPAWVEQLNDGGIIVAPVGSRHAQAVTIARKTEEDLETMQTIGCVFVPMLGEHGWDAGGQ